MSHNFAHGFFLKAGDSVNDQPNDNEFNVKAKYIYSYKNALWDEEYVSTYYSLPMMNNVIVITLTQLSYEAGTTIRFSFEVTNILPLRPLSITEAACHTCIFAIQIGTWGNSLNSVLSMKG